MLESFVLPSKCVVTSARRKMSVFEEVIQQVGSKIAVPRICGGRLRRVWLFVIVVVRKDMRKASKKCVRDAGVLFANLRKIIAAEHFVVRKAWSFPFNGNLYSPNTWLYYVYSHYTL